MRILHTSLAVLSLLSSLSSARHPTPAPRYYSTHDYYVLEHDPNGTASPHECASSLGLEIVEQAAALPDHWFMRIPKPSGELVKRGVDPVMERLEFLRRSAQEQPHVREARSLRDAHCARRIVTSVRSLDRQIVRKRTKRDDSLLHRAPPPIAAPPPEEADAHEENAKMIAERFGIHDPIFSDQWHLVNDAFPRHMVNATPVWASGITGKGVIAAMVDDGVDMNSDDLAANFDPSGSYDFNDHVPLPKPVLWDDHHGTRCAGEIAAVKNDVCGIGIAYESKVAGLRILSGPISDYDEAAALNYAFQNTSIYSCSWGPPDDGRSMEGPSRLIQKAVVNGVTKGRGGLGSIFVFAAGNGAAAGDQCNFDGYTNSIFSVTVASIDYKGLHPYYSEICAANMVVTYSSGSGRHIHTTDVGKNQCSSSHGGTSAAAPIAVGVFALALEVRPDLSWRDVQHLCVRTAVQVNPADPDWEMTAAHRPFSYKYGYGKLDASLYVDAARTWKTVKPQAWFEVPTIELAGADMDAHGKLTGGLPIVPGGVTSTTTITPELLSNNNLEQLEHVTVKVWISHAKRGDVQVEIVSPKGVKSILAGPRKSDDDKNGFVGWQFSTLKHWDEDPLGQWTIRVSDQNDPARKGTFHGWSMTLWGASIDPAKAVPWALPEPPSSATSPPVSSTATSVPNDTAIVTVTSDSAAQTKSYAKPGAHLPTDHGDAPGESHKLAFPTNVDIEKPENTTVSTPTPDEGYFTHMSDLLKNQTWLFAAIGAVILFGLSTVAFFWWRRMRHMRAHYARVAGDERGPAGPSSGRARSRRRGAPTSKDLYDAFGEVSDDDADESMALTERMPGIQFHAGFLEDDAEPKSAYRDEPLPGQGSVERAEDTRERAHSPDSTSGDGSWEHASDAR